MPGTTRRDRGFTLIELIIVITIIALLASIVLALMSGARIKGRNSARNQTVEQYTKALELVRTQDGSYPTIAQACLGDYSDDACWTNGVGVAENAGLNASLVRFIQNPPGDNVPLNGVLSAEGFLYRSPQVVGGVSYVYTIEWYLEGTSATCISGAITTQGYNGYNATRCQYLHK